MSDDGYEPASPYDDYDDYWDEDQQVDLADDLAQHASYSPVWQETPAGELDHYHSDWEYYSDDYYDDDPAIAKYTMDGTHSPDARSRRQPDKRRNKKRKLDDAEEGKPNSSKSLLVSTIRGTVWASTQPPPLELYEKGQNEEVELLKNWRDLFLAQDGIAYTFGKGQLRQDESWANDMSLADMGLSRTQEAAVGVTEGEILNRYAEDDEESDDLGTEDMSDVNDHDMEADGELRHTSEREDENTNQQQFANSGSSGPSSGIENYAIVSSHKSNRQRKASATQTIAKTSKDSFNDSPGDFYDPSKYEIRSSDRKDSVPQLGMTEDDSLEASMQRQSQNATYTSKKRRRSHDVEEPDALWNVRARYNDTKHRDREYLGHGQADPKNRSKQPPGKMQKIE